MRIIQSHGCLVLVHGYTPELMFSVIPETARLFVSLCILYFIKVVVTFDRFSSCVVLFPFLRHPIKSTLETKHWINMSSTILFIDNNCQEPHNKIPPPPTPTQPRQLSPPPLHSQTQQNTTTTSFQPNCHISSNPGVSGLGALRGEGGVWMVWSGLPTNCLEEQKPVCVGDNRGKMVSTVIRFRILFVSRKD